MKNPEPPKDAAEDPREDEPFLRRWARRKGQAAANPEPEPDEENNETAAGPEASEPEPSNGDPPGEPENDESESAMGDEDMPPLESIDQGGSVADFFSPRVSQELRRAALRRLFSQRALPVGDELDDYAGDYTKFTKLGDLVTNEMRHRLEVARQRLAKRAEEQLASTDPESEVDPMPQAEVAAAERDDDESDPDRPAAGEAEDEERSDV